MDIIFGILAIFLTVIVIKAVIYNIEKSKKEAIDEILNEQNNEKKYEFILKNKYFILLLISLIVGIIVGINDANNGAICFIAILITSETLLFVWNHVIKVPTKKDIELSLRQSIEEEQKSQEFARNKEIYGLIDEDEPVGIKKYVKYTAGNLVELTGCPKYLLLNEYTSVENEHSKFSDPNSFNKYWIVEAGYKYTTVKGTPDLRYKHNPYLPEHYRINIKLEDQIFYITTYDKNVFKGLIKYFRGHGIWLQKYNSMFANIFAIILLILMPFLFVIWCCF